MKRSPLRRKTPLRAQQAGLERRTPLRPGGEEAAPKRTGRERESDAAREAREAWHKLPFHALCVACGQPVQDAPPHHVVPKQALKRVAKKRGIPAWLLLWDVRARVVTCLPCHAAHENASPRLAFAHLSLANLHFTRDVGCEHYLGPRYYR